MNKKKFISIAKEVVNLEIKALQILKKNINKSFSEAVVQIAKCQSKVILCGVGKVELLHQKLLQLYLQLELPLFFCLLAILLMVIWGVFQKKIF